MPFMFQKNLLMRGRFRTISFMVKDSKRERTIAIKVRFIRAGKFKEGLTGIKCK